MKRATVTRTNLNRFTKLYKLYISLLKLNDALTKLQKAVDVVLLLKIWYIVLVSVVSSVVFLYLLRQHINQVKMIMAILQKLERNPKVINCVYLKKQ